MIFLSRAEILFYSLLFISFDFFFALLAFRGGKVFPLSSHKEAAAALVILNFPKICLDFLLHVHLFCILYILTEFTLAYIVICMHAYHAIFWYTDLYLFYTILHFIIPVKFYYARLLHFIFILLLHFIIISFLVLIISVLNSLHTFLTGHFHFLCLGLLKLSHLIYMQIIRHNFIQRKWCQLEWWSKIHFLSWIFVIFSYFEFLVLRKEP